MASRPRTALGRALLARKEKKAEAKRQQEGRQALVGRFAPLLRQLTPLKFAGLRNQLIADIDAIRTRERALDTVADAGTRATQLTQLGTDLDAIATRLATAQSHEADLQRTATRLFAAGGEIAKLPAGTDKTALERRLTTAEQGVRLVGDSRTLAGVAGIVQLATAAETLRADAALAVRVALKAQLDNDRPALLRRCTTASALDATTPEMTLLVQQMVNAQAQLPAVVTPDNVADAKAKAQAVTDAVAAVEARNGVEATLYTQRLAAARAALAGARPSMVGVDAKQVEVDWIAAAERAATAGRRQAAFDLLAKVKPHCDAAVLAGLGSTAYAGWAGDFIRLVEHPQSAAFATEIASLNRRLATVKANATAGTGNAAQKEMGLLHWEAARQFQLAEQHALYVAALDPAVQRLEALRQQAPVAANAAVFSAEFAALDALHAKAQSQARKRIYENAQAAVAKLDGDRAALATLKQAHADQLAEKGRVTALLQALAVAAPGTPVAGETAALQLQAGQADALADPGRDWAGALTAWQRIGARCAACRAALDAGTQDAAARDTALTSLDGDTAAALAAVRALLDDLRTRPGHAGIAQQIADIARLVGEADVALQSA